MGKYTVFIMVIFTAWNLLGCQEAFAQNGDAPKPPSNYWISDFFSEEQGGMRCPAGYALKGIKCQGRFCDNKQFYCWPLPRLSQSPGAKIYSDWFSEEEYSNERRLIQNYHLTGAFNPVTGLQCKGNYCDNMRLEQAAGSGVSTGYCQQAPFFSEEWHENQGIGDFYVCPYTNGYVAGIACQGRYCGRISLYCCEMK